MLRIKLSKPQPSSTTLGLRFEVAEREIAKLKRLKKLLPNSYVSIDDDETVVICCDGAGYNLEDRLIFREMLKLVADGKAKLVRDWGDHDLFSPISDHGTATNMFDSVGNEYESVYLIGLHLDPCPARCPVCYLQTTWQERLKLPENIDSLVDRMRRHATAAYKHVIKVINGIITTELGRLESSDRHYTVVDIYIAYTTPDVSVVSGYYNEFWDRMEHYLHLQGFERWWGFRKEVEKDKKELTINIVPVVSTTPWHSDKSHHLLELGVEPSVITLTHEHRQFNIDYYDYNDLLKEKIRELRIRYRNVSIVINALLYRYYDKRFDSWDASSVPMPEVISEATYIQLVSYHPEPNRLKWIPPTRQDILDAVNDVLEYAPVDKLIFDASSTVRLFKRQQEVVAWIHKMERERYYRCSPLGCVNNLVCPRDSNRCLALE